MTILCLLYTWPLKPGITPLALKLFPFFLSTTPGSSSLWAFILGSFSEGKSAGGPRVFSLDLTLLWVHLSPVPQTFMGNLTLIKYKYIIMPWSYSSSFSSPIFHRGRPELLGEVGSSSRSLSERAEAQWWSGLGCGFPGARIGQNDTGQHLPNDNRATTYKGQWEKPWLSQRSIRPKGSGHWQEDTLQGDGKCQRDGVWTRFLSSRGSGHLIFDQEPGGLGMGRRGAFNSLP